MLDYVGLCCISRRWWYLYRTVRMWLVSGETWENIRFKLTLLLDICPVSHGMRVWCDFGVWVELAGRGILGEFCLSRLSSFSGLI